MKAPVIEKRFHDANLVAKLNRQALNEAGAVAISISGGPGCGKTALIDATMRRLMPDVHVGVIACDVASHLDADRMSSENDQVVQVNTGEIGYADATHIHDAMQWLDLNWIELLFIENVGTLVGPAGLDLGQNVTATIFSVAGGHDKADKHPEWVQAAGVILLNKIDLLQAVPFDLDAFRGDVRRLNPNAELIELSSLSGKGMDRWVDWLKARIKKAEVPPKTSEWFG